MSISVNTGGILDMQRKLYVWSRNNPEKVFSDLFNLVCDRRTLMLAWKQLSKNQGSRTPGVDGLTCRKIEDRPGGIANFLEDVREELRKGTYQPQPVRERLIPKPGKPGKFRPLGIPTIKDRLVQMALKIILEPIFEADFYPTSYGFRRGRSTLDALAMIQRHLMPTRVGDSPIEYVIEGDIKGCFDSIDHHKLMQRIERRVRDRKVLRLILSFLKAGILSEGEIRHPVTGTPQGGVLSPLLANIFLTAIDERYKRWTPSPYENPLRAAERRIRSRKAGIPSLFIVRYADDFVILVTGTEKDAVCEKNALSEFLEEELGLSLSVEKTLVTKAECGFDFLGYHVIKSPALATKKLVGKLLIPKGKTQLLKHRIKAMTGSSTTGMSLEELLKTLNPLIAGWRNYYRYAVGASRTFHTLDDWLWHRIQLWLRKKYKKATCHEIRRKFMCRESATRWIWGEGQTQLDRFTKGGTARYRNRGYRISNGWNDDMDDVHFYNEAARNISGFTILGEHL
jgi:group II intron reverse transcriptase/maturase